MPTFTRTLLATGLLAAGLAAFTPAPALHAASLIAERAEAALDPDLRVQVTGVASNDGHVWIGVYADKAGYEAGDEIVQTNVPARRGEVSAAFAALPVGVYAVVAFHDANANNDFDRNFIGIPSERFGFSNISPRMRRARWEEAVFEHDADQTVTVDLVGAGR